MKDASTTGTTGDTALTGTLPLLPDKDSSYVDDTPCRPTPPLRLLLPLQQRRQAERKLAQTPCRRQQTSHRDCDSLRITLVIKTTNHLPEDQPPTLTTDYLARPTKWEPISHSVTSNRSFASTAIQVQPSTFGGSNIDAKHLGNYRCQYHESISCTSRIQSVYSLFLCTTLKTRGFRVFKYIL